MIRIAEIEFLDASQLRSPIAQLLGHTTERSFRSKFFKKLSISKRFTLGQANNIKVSLRTGPACLPPQ
jgi:hypothetical protein